MPVPTSRAFPQREISPGLSTIPNVAADLTTEDSYVFQIVLVNKTAGAVTVTITDKASPAKTLIPTVSIAANTSYVIAYPEGVKMTGGINWVASAASSIDAEIHGYVQG